VTPGQPSGQSSGAPRAREAAVLSVRDLRTWFHTRAGILKAVDGVSFDLHPGEIHGLVGESGSGKSITAFSILGLIDRPGRIESGSVRLGGCELVGLSEGAMRQIRGRDIAMIFQDPMMTLNPMLRIDAQMIDAIQAHERTSRRAALDRSLEALRRVGIPSPGERIRAYPHQFSGGMRQRVAIAIALLNNPKVIVADEPTTALDVTIQAQILYEVGELARATGTALIWITHDLSVISDLADTISVMYAGRIVEQGAADTVLEAPGHPYTEGLLNSLPAMNERGRRLHQIPGMTPPLGDLPAGCPFRPRCGHATEDCRAEPPIQTGTSGRWMRCFHPLVAMPAEEGGATRPAAARDP